MPTAAERIVEFLAAQGVDRAFCVPGESYIALLDALHAHPSLDLVTCRSEGGAGGGVAERFLDDVPTATAAPPSRLLPPWTAGTRTGEARDARSLPHGPRF